MIMHELVFDCSTKEVKVVELSEQEQAALVDQWAQKEAQEALRVKTKSIDERLKALEQKVGING